jgi:hypothetical protein
MRIIAQLFEIFFSVVGSKTIYIQHWQRWPLNSNEKLKVLKKDLKVWNKEVLGNLDRRIEMVVKEIRKINLKVEIFG